MPKKLHQVQLSAEERQELEELTSRGQVQVRVYKRARILLLADAGIKDAEIGKNVGTSGATVARIGKRYQEEKAKGAIAEKPKPGRPSIFEGQTRAKITALACSKPPQGHARWDLRLLADKAVELAYVDAISHVTVGKILKKTSLLRTSRGSGA
jgi:transposase